MQRPPITGSTDVTFEHPGAAIRSLAGTEAQITFPFSARPTADSRGQVVWLLRFREPGRGAWWQVKELNKKYSEGHTKEVRGYTEAPSCIIQYAKVPDGKPCSVMTETKATKKEALFALNVFAPHPSSDSKAAAITAQEFKFDKVVGLDRRMQWGQRE